MSMPTSVSSSSPSTPFGSRPRASGLEGVVVADTVLSHVDGERGVLILRGHSVETLAASAHFEDALALFVDGALPSDARRDDVRARLGAARSRVTAALDPQHPALTYADGMEALMALVATVGRAVSVDEGDALERAARGAALVGTLTAAWQARRAGRALVAADPARGHVADLLRIVEGRERSAEDDAARVAGLERYLVTVMDHGMNASTFTARVVASTGSDLVSSLVAAIGALKGPLHGGAPGPVLDMLDAIGEPGQAEAWLEREVAEGRRVMGMGHRIYRVRDPRAAVLEEGIEQLERARPSGRLALARRVEREAERILARRHPERPLRANVEFFTAVLLEAVGLDRSAFAATFAAGRAAGWCAHVEEQRREGRLIRPASNYTGPLAP